MSLVAYASSDDDSDSHNEDAMESATNTDILKASVENHEPTKMQANLFTLLPPPKTTTVIQETEDYVPPVVSAGKIKGPVKIAIPSLDNFKEDEQVSKAKKMKLTPKGSGLIGILPKPQNITFKDSQRKLTPHILNKPATKAKIPVKSTKTVTRTFKTVTKTTTIIPRVVSTKKVLQTRKRNSDDEEDEDVVDFFSLDKKDDLPEYIPPVDPLPSSSSLLKAYDMSNESTTAVNNSTSVHLTDSTSRDPNSEPEEEGVPVNIPEGPELFVQEGFLRLTGKKQRGKEEINFIEINAADQVPNKDEWLKSISTEKATTSHKKGGMPSAQSRRKHQITYLAFQAKERELELKNQWAMNRMTRQQTQARYGF